MRTIDLESLSKQWNPIAELLSPIKNNADYEEARALLDQLIDEAGSDESHPLASLMYHLGKLIADYENADDELNNLGNKGDAVSMIRFLMDQHGLKQAALKDIFGSQGNVSEVLRGTRELNLRHIKKLAEKFHVDPSVFIDNLNHRDNQW